MQDKDNKQKTYSKRKYIVKDWYNNQTNKTNWTNKSNWIESVLRPIEAIELNSNNRTI